MLKFELKRLKTYILPKISGMKDFMMRLRSPGQQDLKYVYLYIPPILVIRMELDLHVHGRLGASSSSILSDVQSAGTITTRLLTLLSVSCGFIFFRSES